MMSERSIEPASKISMDVDLAAPGVQHGHLTIPHSRNSSPWGSLLMPISVFKNGAGPTILLTGGNHGDEYEGPIAIMNLIRNLDIDKISGRVILIPALNYPALKSGTRLSPIDGKNMNRAFPGNANGTVTDMIADFLYRFVLPLCDVVLDFHAGGTKMSFLPTSVIHRLPDKDQMARTINAARAFGAPNCLVLEELDAGGMLDSAVEDMGKVFISTELGGGGGTTPQTVSIAANGAHDVLVHFEILAEPALGTGNTRFLETPEDAYVIALHSGILQFTRDLGKRVAAGDTIGYIHDIDHPTAAPKVYRAGVSGLVIHQHVCGQIGRGDCLCVIAVEAEDL